MDPETNEHRRYGRFDMKLNEYCNYNSGYEPSAEQCSDLDGTAYDSLGTGGCSSYTSLVWCGGYDDDDFSANTMCCFCGGGTTFSGMDSPNCEYDYGPSHGDGECTDGRPDCGRGVNNNAQFSRYDPFKTAEDYRMAYTDFSHMSVDDPPCPVFTYLGRTDRINPTGILAGPCDPGYDCNDCGDLILKPPPAMPPPSLPPFPPLPDRAGIVQVNAISSELSFSRSDAFTAEDGYTVITIVTRVMEELLDCATFPHCKVEVSQRPSAPSLPPSALSLPPSARRSRGPMLTPLHRCCTPQRRPRPRRWLVDEAAALLSRRWWPGRPPHHPDRRLRCQQYTGWK